MTKLTKAGRVQLHAMFDGRCAYCGHPLPERWHADHIEPVIRTDWAVRRGWSDGDGKPINPQNDRPDNFFPACPQCNISKASMSIEAWRGWLEGHIKSLNRDHSIYRLSKAFGLIAETGASVCFYFERTALSLEQGEKP